MFDNTPELDNLYETIDNQRVVLRKNKWLCTLQFISGPAVSLLLIFAACLLHLSGYYFLEFNSLLILSIIYTVFSSNIFLGYLTASFGTLCHFFLHLYISFTFPPPNPSISILIINIAAVYAAVFISGRLKSCTKKRISDLDQSLEQSEKNLKAITDNMLDIVTQIDPHGIYRYVSPSCKEITGYDPEELVGKSFYEFIHPEDLIFVKRVFGNSLKSKAPRTLYYRRKQKNGCYIWVETSGKAMFDGDMNPTGIITCSRDITERRKTQTALRESEEKFRELFHNANDAIFLHEFNGYGEHGKFVEINDVACREYGYSREEFLSLASSDIDLPEDSPISKELLKQYASNDHVTFEKTLTTKNGSKIPVEINSHVFRLNGKKVVLAIARNITERKKAETALRESEEQNRLLKEALELDKLRTEFFANISHEFRTPLNVMLSTIQLNEMYHKNQNSTSSYSNGIKHIEIIKQNCYRLLRLVNNLIDITKIDSGFFDLQLQNCNIINIVEEITLSVAHYIENKGLTLLFDTDIEEKILACDPDKIERIILNLLSNAVKFTKPGGQIHVIFHDCGNHLQLTVSDTGIGIPPEKVDYVFERFRQVNKSLSRDHEGSGIGLSLVKSLVELHGGIISLKSQLDIGSQFTIELPVKLLPEKEIVFESNCTGNRSIERITVEFSDIYQSHHQE